MTIIIVVLAFVFSYDDWGAEKFDLIIGLKNFFFAMLYATLAVFAAVTGHKLSAIFWGFRCQYKIWYAGLIVAVLVALLSQGKLFFLPFNGLGPKDRIVLGIEFVFLS